MCIGQRGDNIGAGNRSPDDDMDNIWVASLQDRSGGKEKARSEKWLRGEAMLQKKDLLETWVNRQKTGPRVQIVFKLSLVVRGYPKDTDRPFDCAIGLTLKKRSRIKTT